MNKRLQRNRKVFEFFKIISYKFVVFDIVGAAAQISYYFLLSLLPLVLFILSIIPYFNIDESTIIETINLVLPSEIQDFSTNLINTILTSASSTVLSLSVIFVLFSGSAAMNSLLKITDRVYNEVTTRNFFITRVQAFFLTGAFILLLLSLISSYTIGSSFVLERFNASQTIIVFLNIFKYFLLPLFAVIFLFTCYLIGSNHNFVLKSYIPGTIVSIIGIVLFSLLFNFYIEHFSNYSIQYGAIGFVIVFMLWIYFIFIIIILGSIINASYVQSRINNNKKVFRK